ncbi:MAG TPA: cytochrome P450, partial [Chloroflexota bacterium]|nr:cytochrome P450 [Chloroflexota bacterium]
NWYVTSYTDVQTLLTHPHIGRQANRDVPPEARPPIPEAYRPFVETAGQMMLFRDPPDHTRLRALVNRAFTPSVVERMRPRISEQAHDLLDKVIAKANTGNPVDLIADFAFPLPVTVIADMLGVPIEYREDFRTWSDALAAAIDVRQTREATARASEATIALRAFLTKLIEDRRRDQRSDILSALIAVEDQGDRLSQDELIAMCFLLLAAGHETTVNLIGNGLLALLQHPDQLERLRRDPTLIVSAVEELLRFDSPVQLTGRVALQDVEVRGRQIKKGQQLSLVLGAANRDPEQFADPDRLDIGRHPNRHLSFGMGIHFCLGAPLARAEGQIALGACLQRLPGLRLASDRVEWREMIAFRGLKTLLVHC